MPKTSNNLRRYQPIEGPTTGQLEMGLWWIKNRVLLYRILIGFLVTVSVIFWSYSLYGFGFYIYKGMEDDQRLVQQFVAQVPIDHNYIVSRGAGELAIGTVNIFSSLGSTYDLAAEIQNPNDKWYVAFDYFFTVGEDQTGLQHEFILPQETKYLTEFLYAGSRTTDVSVHITNVSWQRVDAREIRDVQQYVQERTDIKVSDVELVSSSSGKVPLNTLKFTARNSSPFNYWEVDFYFLLQSGSRLTGINKYKIEQFKSGESHEMEIAWPGRLSSSKVKIVSSVDIFNESNYMPFELGPGQLK